MAFCINCGHELADDANFCGNCGKAVCENFAATQRKTVYEGELHKCPSCGEILNSFLPVCPSCGHELRGVKTSSSVKEFAQKLELASSEHQTILLIKNFPIPNTKEDIYEYMILAASNITSNVKRDIFDAWKVKFEQSYQKATLLLKNDPSLSELQLLHEQTLKRISRIETNRSAKTIGTIVGKSGKATGRFIFQNAHALPNMVICAAWVISLIVLIPLCNGLDGKDYVGIMFFDIVGGAIIIPFVARSRSSIPRLIIAIGLVASMGMLIPLCSGRNGDDYVALLFFEIVAAVIIVARVFIKPNNSSKE